MYFENLSSAVYILTYSSKTGLILCFGKNVNLLQIFFAFSNVSLSEYVVKIFILKFEPKKKLWLKNPNFHSLKMLTPLVKSCWKVSCWKIAVKKLAVGQKSCWKISCWKISYWNISCWWTTVRPWLYRSLCKKQIQPIIEEIL